MVTKTDNIHTKYGLQTDGADIVQVRADICKTN